MIEKLQIIREKCIAANPQRPEGWDYDSGKPEGSGYMDHAPCRLADVLQAIATERRKGLRSPYLMRTSAMYEIQKVIDFWNLPTDDLEKQGESTINYICDLFT